MKRGAALVAAAVFAWALASGCGTTPRTATSAGDGGSGAATTAGGAGAGAGGPVACDACTLLSGCSGFANDEIDEASGIAPSAAHDGVFYLHNDSGDSARFFATNCAGDDLGTFELDDTEAIDWEDMGRGPCGAKQCLYFADTGDNRLARASYDIYRVLEPAELGAGEHKVIAERLTFTYPDGAHDSEAFLIHPTTGEMAVVTKVKETGKSFVYAFPAPFSPGATVTLTQVGELEPPTGSARITGGAVSPTGDGILLRTYTSLFFYSLADKSFGEALTAPPCEMPVMLQLQGEAVTFTTKGDGYVTVSEQTGQSLHFSACK